MLEKKPKLLLITAYFDSVKRESLESVRLML
jgi:hypothetical protein